MVMYVFISIPMCVRACAMDDKTEEGGEGRDIDCEREREMRLINETGSRCAVRGDSPPSPPLPDGARRSQSREVCHQRGGAGQSEGRERE